LNVKGCKNLYESFVDYCAVETLDGDNKYFAEGYGLQNAKKGVIFKSFPPVLHLQLKRFDYDMMNDRFIKINDRHEFGMTLDIDDFLDSDADRSVKQHYRLQGYYYFKFSVLVHSGDLNAGHYFALIRPDRNGNWFKYDDDKVIPVTEREVLDGNFGGEIPPTNISSNNKIGSKFFTNAYMLVYVRECDEEEILGPVTDEDIPLHLRKDTLI
jgi:ubiquitin carboxyl-terminal hydrolase 7